jgi:hypothetical protein
MPFDNPNRINEIINICCKRGPKGSDPIDVHFFKVPIDEAAAGSLREELIQLLSSNSRMKDGPSYIELGGDLGDQGMALMLLALGKALNLWEIITPATLGISGPKADEIAGSGFVMCSGMQAA